MTEVYYSRRNRFEDNILRGHQRKGFQGPKEALTDIELAELTGPRYERPAVMIESLRFVSGDTSRTDSMTAKSHALYEYLMAAARADIEGRGDQEFQVPVKAAQEYLGVARRERIVDYLSVISSTMVTYDFRMPGYKRSQPIPLMLCQIRRHEASGDQMIVYTIHPAVEATILNARRYAMLELNASRKFTSKYTARLYPLLALMAGQTIRNPIEMTPEELAKRVGWPTEDLHFGTFQRLALQPILDDINPAKKKAPAVSMFRVAMQLKRTAGPRSPVEKIVFTVEPNAAPLRQTRAAKLRGTGAHTARRHIEGLDAMHVPATGLIAQAVTKTGKTVTAIRQYWLQTVRGLLRPSNCNHHLAKLLTERGVGHAFCAWVDKFGANVPSFDDDDDVQSSRQPLIIVEKSKQEQKKEHAINVAYQVSRITNDIRPAIPGMPEVPCSYDDAFIKDFADPDMWLMLEGAGVKHHARIRKAFSLTASQDPQQMRKSIYNLASRIETWDLERAAIIASAIILDHKDRAARQKELTQSAPVVATVHAISDEDIPF